MKDTKEGTIGFLEKNPKLLNVALDFFSQKPFALCSLNDIIKDSGLNKGSFYYRFEDKKALYFAVLNDLFVHQNKLFSDQMKTVSHVKNIRDMTTVVFLNSFLLHRVDNRYLSLLKMAYSETKSLKEERKKVCVSTLQDRFLLYLENHLEGENGNKEINKTLLLNYLAFTHIHLPTILLNDFSEEGIQRLIEAIFFGLNNPKITWTPDRPLESITGSSPLSWDGESPREEPVLSLRPGEIFAFMGEPKSGNIPIQRILATMEDVQNGKMEYLSADFRSLKSFAPQTGFSLDKPLLSMKKSVAQNIKTFLAKGSRQAELGYWLNLLSMASFGDQKVETLSDSGKLKLNALRIAILNPRLIFVTDLLKELFPSDKDELCELLLKCRAGGSTIVLSTTQMSDVLAIADRVAFLAEGKILMVETVAKLKEKYQKKCFIVEYLDGGVENKALFSEEQLRSPEFQKLIGMKTIRSIETKSTLDKEIFQLETGVEM